MACGTHARHRTVPYRGASEWQVFDQTRTNRQQPDVEQADAKADERMVFDDFRISEASGQHERQVDNRSTRNNTNSVKLGSCACYFAFVCNSFAVENLSIESQAVALPKATVHRRFPLARYSCTMVQIGALEGDLQK